MTSNPIRDADGNRIFDAVYRDDGVVIIEVKNAKQRYCIDLINVLRQIEQGKRKAAADKKPNTK